MTSTISPLWRFLVTDLDGSSITLLDGLASERMVTPRLHEPLEVSGTVPSDSPYVNRIHTDGFPLLAEGVRQLYCFRRESDTSPYYKIRASTLIMQVNDAASTGDARSRFTAFDPWQYLFNRPVLQSSLGTIGESGNPGVNGELITRDGLYYPESLGANTIIQDILLTSLTYGDASAPTAARKCFIDPAGGTIESCPAPGTSSGGPGAYKIQQGTSIGEVFKNIVDTGACDIILLPIHDPVGRPGILCELNIYSGASPSYGAGSFRYRSPFAWDRPGRSVTGVNNLYDGSSRANHILYYYESPGGGTGGPPIATYSSPSFRDPVSIATYGEYIASQFFAGYDKAAVSAMADQQLELRSTFKQTLLMNPAPERAPEPFVDYYLGDRVPVYVSNNMRQEVPPGISTEVTAVHPANSATVVVASTNGFGSWGSFVMNGVITSYTGTTPISFTGCGPHPATVGGEKVVLIAVFAWQRVTGLHVEIDDNGVETVRELEVGPAGGAPPVADRVQTQFNTATATSRRQSRRAGGVQVIRNGQFSV